MPDPAFSSNIGDRERPPVALIAGPTASGKSAVALRLAKTHGGIVINADASQVYFDLAVLTARPSPDEIAQAPHRLFGHIDGAQAYSAAAWAGEAHNEIARAHAQGLLPILVGGTGLYLDTLLHGIAPIPDIDPAIRAAVRALPVAEAYAALAQEDAISATRLNAGDTARVARALEVMRSTGHPLHHWQTRRTGGLLGQMPIRAAVIMLPREELAQRADRRLDQMLAGGAIGEVAALLARDLPADRPILRALGVREISAALADRLSLTEARAAILSGTTAYQKRQITWARNRQRAWTKLAPHEIATLDDLPILSVQ